MLLASTYGQVIARARACVCVFGEIWSNGGVRGLMIKCQVGRVRMDKDDETAIILFYNTNARSGMHMGNETSWILSTCTYFHRIKLQCFP